MSARKKVSSVATALETVRRDPRVRSAWSEGADGLSDYRPGECESLWADLAPGFQYDGEHSLHEDSGSDLITALAAVVSCDCDGCTKELGKARS